MLTKEITKFCVQVLTTGRIVSLDLGTKYIGIANTDIAQEFSFPHSVFTRKNLEFDLDFFTNFVIERKAVAMIVGLPEEGNKMRKIAQDFAKQLLKKCFIKLHVDFPILLYDECMTSRLANEMLYDENLSLKKNIEKNDQVAAHILLKEVLDFCNRMRKK